MYTAEAVSGIIGSFISRVDDKVRSGTPNAGQHPSLVSKGLRTEQRYVNGNTDLGRMSVTAIEKYRDDELVLQHFTLSNFRFWSGEDAPRDVELDETVTYRLWVNRLSGHYGAEYRHGDNVSFADRLDFINLATGVDSEALRGPIEADDSNSERPLEPGEIEYIGYLLTQVVSSNG